MGYSVSLGNANCDRTSFLVRAIDSSSGARCISSRVIDGAPADPDPDENWDGRGGAMDSNRYPEYGYRSTRDLVP
ncbi:MAG: hypothetical protein P1U85_10775 [Verrucomicrobiales bacterium]|nr:hypothetical protein [Verrucomicrobiales bacterium]